MNYESVNSLSDFEFHDARFSFISFENGTLTISAKYLNIHKGTAQNSSDKDMEIDLATLKFDGFSLIEYEPGRTWKQDENGKLHTDEPLVIYTGSQAEDLFLKDLRFQTTVLDFGMLENMRYYLDGIGENPFFTARFSFDKCTVYWDSLRKESWYEEKLHKQ